MPTTPLGPLTETVSISELDDGLVAHAWNGPHRILIALKHTADDAFLVGNGVGLRETLPGVKADDVLDLLAAGKCGDFSVDVHTVRPAARRDVEFGGSF